MKVIWRFVGLFARIAALVVTAGLLVATSAVPQTCEWTAPVTFRAAGTCGSGGLIVVDRSEASNQLVIHNAAALGLPPLATASSSGFGPQVRHQSSCPTDYDQGRWSVEFSMCALDAGTGPGDANPGADSGPRDADGDSGVSPSDAAAPMGVSGCTRKCEATVSGAGALLFTCTGPAGEPRCQSRLTVVE
jgi:hypothetical protein